ncbi:MAG: family 43 glycosylhydrolase [Solirubrobacteraceae bacterium MAG38_C4-C5]|nr:family 43 glycosylhydrolase [Candidatus Siliceabacter maunaloa]
MRAGSEGLMAGRRWVIRLAAAGLLGVLALAVGLPGAAQAQSGNPLFDADPGSADPGVSFLEGQFRVTSTGGPRVRNSPDLVNWREDEPLFAPGGEPRWAEDQRAGSPKIYPLADGRFVLLFSARHEAKGKGCIGRAISSTPNNFRNMGRESFRHDVPAEAGPLECEGDGVSASDRANQRNRLEPSAFSLIDPALFVNPANGEYYLLYKRQLQDRIDAPKGPSDIVIRPINSDVLSGLGGITRLVVASGDEGVSVEAPTMIARNGRYFLFYSIANFSNDSYAVSVAVSRREANTPTGGDFVKFGGNPIYSGRGNPNFCGVGHQDVLQTGSDSWILFAHANLNEKDGATPGDRNECVGSRRQLVADTLRFDIPSSEPANQREGFAWPSVSNGTPSGDGTPRGTLTPFTGAPAQGGSPQGGSQESASSQTASPVSHYGGVTAYSERVVGDSPAADRYFLTVAREGQTSRVAIPPRAGVPFDVDLGPDEDGDVVAVYSRCATEPDPVRVRDTFGARVFAGPYPAWTAGRGCDVFRLDLDDSETVENRIGGASTADSSEVLPSIWRDRVAFVRVYERRSGRRGTYPYLYTRPLDGGSSVREEGGSRGTSGLPGPVRLDLYGRRLGFVWNYSTGEPESGEIAGTTEVRLDTVGSRSRRVLSQADWSDQPASYVGPTGSRGRLFYGYQRIQPRGESAPTSVTSLRLRYRISTGDRGLTSAPELLVDTATDRDSTVSASSPSFGFTGPTTITGADGVAYSD